MGGGGGGVAMRVQGVWEIFSYQFSGASNDPELLTMSDYNLWMTLVPEWKERDVGKKLYPEYRSVFSSIVGCKYFAVYYIQ